MDSALSYGVTSFEHAKAPWPVILRDDLRPEHDSLVATRADQRTRFPFEAKVPPMGVESVSLDRLYALADSMNVHGAYLCPTMNAFDDVEGITNEIAEEVYEGEGDPPPMMVGMIRASVIGLKSVGLLCVREFAARMFVGQDGDDPVATAKEMQLMVDAGVSPLEVLRGATIYPAEWLGVSDRVGSISVGKEANLVLLESNPLDSISNVTRPAFVVYRGRLLSRVVENL